MGADGFCEAQGSSVDRKAFQRPVGRDAERNNGIEFVHVKEADCDGRFLRCVELVKEMMGERG